MKFRHLFSVIFTFIAFFICSSCDLYKTTFSDLYSDYNTYSPISIDIDMEYEDETRIFNIADNKVVKEIFDAIKECKYSKAIYEPISNMDLKLNFDSLSSISMSSKYLFKDGQYYTNLKEQSEKIENIVIDYAKDNGIITNKTNDKNISTAEFKMRFDYGNIVEGVADLLWGDCSNSFGIKDLKAGDIVRIYYTGELYFLQTYPSQLYFDNGELKNAEVFRANIVNFTVYQVPGGGYDIIADDGENYKFPEYIVYGDNFTSINNVYQNLKLQGTMVHNETDNKIVALYAIDYDPSKVDNNDSQCKIIEYPTSYYIDTGYPSSGEDAFDAYTLVTYKSDLNWYYQNNKDKADLESYNSGKGFLDVINQYDTHWFDEKALIIIPLIETSGSNRHQVLSYQVEESKLKVNIKSIIPDIGTCDMAGWHIIVEINKSDLESIDDVEIYLDGQIINPYLEERYLSDWFSFLKHSDVSDIIEIQWVDYKGSVVPGVLQDCKFTTNIEDITSILNYFKNFKLKNLGNACLEPMPAGAAYDYYCFITKYGNYKIYLDPYYMKYFDTYSANFNVPEMQHYTQANNLLSHSIVYDAYYTSNEIFKIDEVDYINELMIKEYTPTQYYMSDMFYIDYGIKLRIIDERHFEYGFKYYEILGSLTFKELVGKTHEYSSQTAEYKVTMVYPSSLITLHPNEIDVIYMSGQTMYVSEIMQLINAYIDDTSVMKYAYLDEDCFIPLNDDIVIEENMKLYISTKNPRLENGTYC